VDSLVVVEDEPVLVTQMLRVVAIAHVWIAILRRCCVEVLLVLLIKLLHELVIKDLLSLLVYH
jgi:hypothetical protein